MICYLLFGIVATLVTTTTTVTATDLVAQEISLLSSEELVYDTDGITELGNYTLYLGQFHKGAAGAAVNYDFRNPLRLSQDTRIILLTDLSSDVSALDWANAALASGSDLLSSEDLADVDAVVTRVLSSGYAIYEQYSVENIRFAVSIISCLNGYLNITVQSSLTLQAPIAGASSLTVINGDCDPGSVTSAMDLNKLDCGIVNQVESLIVISSGDIINNENSQMFALTCSVNTENFALEANVTDVSAPVTEIQNVFDSAFVSALSVLDPSDESPLTSAELGDPIMLKIELESTFKNDFDIQIQDCFVDGELVLDDGSSVNRLFPEFVEQSKGLFVNSFNLFRKKNSFLNERRVTFVCVVETCLDDCANPSRKRKKRSISSGGERKYIRSSRPSERIGLALRLK